MLWVDLWTGLRVVENKWRHHRARERVRDASVAPGQDGHYPKPSDDGEVVTRPRRYAVRELHHSYYRVAHMLEVAREITDGKGTGFFVFIGREALAASDPLEA